jgi:hypothetical protein
MVRSLTFAFATVCTVAAAGMSIGTSDTNASSDAASRLTFKVDSFKMVSASCQ